VRLGYHVGPSYVADRVEGVLEGYTCHSLRHRFATCAYRATKDIRAVQELLGHSSPTTTAKYVLIDEDAMEAAVLSVA
jgi:integrase